MFLNPVSEVSWPQSCSKTYVSVLGLFDGINARNKSLLVKSIQNAKDGGYSKTLAKLIKKAEETLEEINKLGLHLIPDMNKKIVSELVSYKVPHQIVFDMCFVTFLLLGEREEIITVS